MCLAVLISTDKEKNNNLQLAKCKLGWSAKGLDGKRLILVGKWFDLKKKIEKSNLADNATEKCWQALGG